MTTPAYPSRARKQAEAAARRDAQAAKAKAPTTAREQFQTIDTAVLVALVSGDIDPRALILDELANRGLHATTGHWAGFEMARKVADAVKGQHGIL